MFFLSVAEATFPTWIPRKAGDDEIDHPYVRVEQFYPYTH